MAKEHWLVEYSRKLFNDVNMIKQLEVHFIDNPADNAFINDIKHHPHAFVLACFMDRQISAERAWQIPCFFRRIYPEFTIEQLAAVSEDEYQRIFEENYLHGFNDTMAKVFHDAVWKIKEDYNGNASRIWSGCPSSATVVYRFLQFEGVGIKIATMATNILARQFRVPFSDYYSIDISPDVQVFRVFRRVGLSEPGDSREGVIYKAREICPEFPGLTDIACWRIGRNFCRPVNPDCDHCPVTEYCPKLIDPPEE